MATSLILDSNPSFTMAFNALPFIQSLNQYYPDIEHWYINKVIPGILTGNDKIIVATDNGRIAGLALGKVDQEEAKLRCIRVHPDYQNNGLGIRLIDNMLDLIEDDKPKVTVSEEMFHLYSRPFVSRYGFSLTGVDKGRYRKGKLEYGFNGG